MQPVREPETATFLSVPHDTVEWGIRAESIRRILRVSEWSAQEPVDLAQRLQWSGACSSRERVLVVATRNGEVGLWAGSEVHFRSHAREELRSLPAELFASPSARKALSAIVLCEGMKPLFVVDPLALERLAESSDRPPSHLRRGEP
ncbi:MAG: hypothetical protein HY898_13740 [Deltaproteobacteria bacterium]|nr:hypothetical protein [Deltaproteobacteria bacterium]